MALARWQARLADLPSIALPSDYPRQHDKVVEAQQTRTLDEASALALLRLALHAEEGDEGDAVRPSTYHLLLSAFVVLLHRYTADADLVIAASSPSTGRPLLLRVKLSPEDSFWAIVRKIQFLEREADEDAVPYEDLVQALGREEGTGPLFRVRFFDESDPTQRSFLQSTSSTTDMTVFISSVISTDVQSSRSSLLPTVTARILYNSLLFSYPRIGHVLDQLVFVLAQAAVRPQVAIGVVNLITPVQQKLLPNPVADLEFCGWRGAITEIFSHNASRHPERRCIVESLVEGRIRTFTYRQIDEASNVLAHHLLAQGIEREDVCTVYSTRGVDLVVAVMGILKAGATFSVIDPAYPASRQEVYLRVAQPRALVILAAAGDLLPPVRKFVQTELSIKCEVPGLQLQDGGRLVAANDLLAPEQKLASQSTGVPLGPDSVGTLSFTSGSTGIPKGVRGRHFSLTHFFPWMSQQFGMDEKERFTMLSGIAHDPIQRDIFTPLFLGAELHIPTAEDIGTPGRLAEWMADSEVTVTHLTPAMGQLLSAQATRQIPTLRNAFFVGDILAKRDCTRLQQLAANVRIINMFGTTETQRAVSYFPIPSRNDDPTFLGASRKDIMPAGSGMINVQLLVVNRNDRNAVCGVGEVGEIYVRSGGLAEGYLQLPDATREKFIPNWFSASIDWPDALKQAGQPHWHGVRDRLYRTGDLGRYDSDGIVECTGRADDQVKIRGFRIELGEIDTHLSRHPLVRENVTLVRRDKDEEKVLVSYFVPLDSAELNGLVSSTEEEADEDEPRDAVLHGLRRYRKLIKDIRDYLRTKLPSYSIPTLFVPLSRMPLNPNGKIDKPALPFPDTAVAAGGSKASSNKPAVAMSPTEQTIHDIWLRLLPSAPSPVSLDDNFFDLGGHSILATRLIFEIRNALAINAPLGIVFDHPTIRGLAEEVRRQSQDDFGLASGSGTTDVAKKEHQQVAAFDYAADAVALIKLLPTSFPSAQTGGSPGKTVLLTGATGFLGAFLLRDLLQRVNEVNRVICLVRAKSTEGAIERLRSSGVDRGAWDEAWVIGGRLQAVVGDLESTHFGLAEAAWSRLTEEADAIVHNGALVRPLLVKRAKSPGLNAGAQVHWIYPYPKLRAANVVATMTALDFAAQGRAKSFVFISTTAAIEKPSHYVPLSDSIVSRGGLGVPESDDLEGAREGLTSGYGQTKWVSERVVMEAGRRGLRGGIVRPAYIVGDSTSAVTNTDDFLWRLIKGCVQLGFTPDIENTINMVPVDHCARIVSLAALNEPADRLPVYQITARPTIRFNDFLAALPRHGYAVEQCEYVLWRTRLEQHVLVAHDNALFPLLHYVVSDLPTSTKSPELDDANTATLLKAAGLPSRTTVDPALMARYLAWLVAADFMPSPPSGKGEPLPAMASARAIGRSGR